MKSIVPLLTVLALNFATSAQTISGKITDVQGAPLTGCNILVKGTFLGASSGADGHFYFEAQPLDTAVVQVSFMGFESVEKTFFNLEKGKNITLNIVLRESFNTLKAVTVTAGRYGTGEVSEVAVLSSLDVATTAGALADVSAAMQTLPGTIRNGESGKLLVRGGTANETGTYIDGILVHKPYTSSAPNTAVRGRFNPFMFSGTAFSTGAYSAEYGQALSSILVMNTNEMPNEETLNLSLMTVGTDLAGTKKWKNGAITASANYMNLAPYMALVPQNYTWLQAPESFGGAVSFRQKTAKNGMVKVYATIDNASLQQQRQNLDTQLDENIGVQNRNRFVNANFKERVGAKWVFKGGASYTLNSDAFATGKGQMQERFEGVHAKINATYQVSERTHAKFGSDYFYTNFYQGFGSAEMLADSTVTTFEKKHTAFAEINHYVSKNLVINAGLRSEFSVRTNAFNLAPRLALAYQFKNEQQVSVAFGRFFQDPDNVFLVVNNQLGAENATHYIISYNKAWKKRTLRTEAYYKNYDGLVKINDKGIFTNAGYGYAYGADVFYRDSKTIKNGDFWVSYSFIQTERNYLNYNELATPSFVNAHTLNVVYKHWFSALRSQLGATLSVGSPRPHNNPNQSHFMADKLPAYKSLDLNWSFLYRENIIFHASISNVLGFKNVFGYNYSNIPDANGVLARSPIVPAANQFFFVGCFITLSKSGSANQLDKL